VNNVEDETHLPEHLNNTVKIAQFDASQKVAPLVGRKLIERPFWTICITDDYEFALACNLDALAIVAGL
jgi:hypothetical protein